MRNAVLEAARNDDYLGSLRTYVNWPGILPVRLKWYSVISVHLMKSLSILKI